MSNVGKIQGPSGTPDSENKKSKKDVDPEAFHRELMKTRETDPDQQRKRKQRQEAIEEAKAQQVAGPPPQVTPPPAEDTFQITTGRGGLGATLGAGPGTGVGAPPPSAPDTSETEVPDEDYPSYTDYQFIEPQFEEPSQPPPQEQQRSRPAEREPSKPSLPIEKKQPTPPLKKSSSKAHPAKPSTPRPVEKKAPSAPKGKETTKPSTPFKPKEKAPQPQEEEKTALPQGGWEAQKTHAEPAKKREKLSEPSTTTVSGAPSLPAEAAAVGFVVPTAPPETAAPYLNFSKPMMDLFERMVGTMTIMTTTGETQTTLSLDAPQFANSVFYGAQVTITEFSTAPKVFNISFLGNTQAATKLFNDNVTDLVAAFKAGQYNFEVGRIDVGIVPPKPSIKRKEKIEPVRKRKE